MTEYVLKTDKFSARRAASETEMHTLCMTGVSESSQQCSEFICEGYIHQPVLLFEAINALNILPEGIYVDGTFGRGGHSKLILQSLNAKGRLICLDKDPQAINYGKQCLEHDPRISFYSICFSELPKLIKENDLQGKINGILLDLGVSSPQLEDPARGFSFMREGPLDMRLDPTKGLSASEWINKAEHHEIVWVLKRYGEETFAKKIARKICETREESPLLTTLQLAQLITNCIPIKKGFKNPATKSFQAIRIHINQELQAIEKALAATQSILCKGGRLAIISFHSLEDRLVKQFFRNHSRIQLPPGIALPEKELIAPFSWVVKRIRASEREIQANPRARSATLRVVQKISQNYT